MYQHSGLRIRKNTPPSPLKAAKKFPDTNATPPHGTSKPTPPHEKFAYPPSWAGTPRPRMVCTFRTSTNKLYVNV